MHLQFKILWPGNVVLVIVDHYTNFVGEVAAFSDGFLTLRNAALVHGDANALLRGLKAEQALELSSPIQMPASAIRYAVFYDHDLPCQDKTPEQLSFHEHEQDY
jgi:hypothetical protein